MLQTPGIDRTSVSSRVFAILGAHGGAGASTVTHWLDPNGDTGTFELAMGSPLPTHYTPLVVARSTVFGVNAAARMVWNWHPGVPRPHLVIVADAPLQLPKPARFRLESMRSKTIGVSHVPYLAQLRETERPADGMTNRAVQKAARALRSSLGLKPERT